MEVESGNGIERVVGQRRDGKRVYGERFKQAVVEQCLAGEASVASIALSHGINANLVRKWIVRRRHEGAGAEIAQRASTPMKVARERHPLRHQRLDCTAAVGARRSSRDRAHSAAYAGRGECAGLLRVCVPSGQ